MWFFVKLILCECYSQLPLLLPIWYVQNWCQIWRHWIQWTYHFSFMNVFSRFFFSQFLHYSASLMVSSWVLWSGFFFLVLQMNNRRVDLELYWCRQCSANRKLVPFLWPLLLIINWLAILSLVGYNFRRQWHVPLKGGCAWASTSGHCCHEPVGQWLLRTNQPTLWTGPSWVSETISLVAETICCRALVILAGPLVS